MSGGNRLPREGGQCGPDPRAIRDDADAVDRSIGRRVRQLRIERGLTLQQMADQIGVSYQQLYKYEKTINRIAASRVYEIAKALGIPVNELFKPVAKPDASLRALSDFMALAVKVPAEKRGTLNAAIKALI